MQQTQTPPQTAIAYGTETLAPSVARALRDGDTAGLDRAGSPVARLPGPGATLRMSNQTPRLGRAATAADLAHADSQLTLLEHHLHSLCGPWDKPLTGFLAAYFVAVRGHIAADAARLSTATGALAGLVEPLHWAFAAPLPLPRAHLSTGDDPGQTDRVDMGFVVNGGVVALTLGRGTPTPATRVQRERLGRAGVRFIDLGRDDLTAPDTLLTRLGPGFCDFLTGVTLPASPFRGSPLGTPRSRPA